LKCTGTAGKFRITIFSFLLASLEGTVAEKNVAATPSSIVKTVAENNS